MNNNSFNKMSKIPVPVKGFAKSFKSISPTPSSVSIEEYPFNCYPELTRNKDLSYIPVHEIYNSGKKHISSKSHCTIKKSNLASIPTLTLTPPPSPQKKRCRYSYDTKSRNQLKKNIPTTKFNYSVDTRRSYAYYVNKKMKGDGTPLPRKSAILNYLSNQQLNKSSQDNFRYSILNSDFFEEKKPELKSCLKSNNSELTVKKYLRFNQDGDLRIFEETDNSNLLTQKESIKIDFSERYTFDAWEYMKVVYFI